MEKKKVKLITSLAIAIAIILGVIVGYQQTGQVDKNEIHKAIDIAIDGITTYAMEDSAIKELPSTEIVEQTEEQENAVGEEQATTETEGFELQGEIAYNGDNEFPSVSLGDYIGLTYYSQIDGRWSSHPYTSVGNPNQTIGSSGCGPTSGAMVVTAIKGVITPNEMGDLYVKYGFRSADNGTYFSAFRWTADTFNIDYKETYKLDETVDLLRNNHYVIVSCGNGLFTTGGHFIVIVGIDGDTLKIYDPYLYAGKFNTSTRRGKVTVDGNTVYCSIDNFREYANYMKFFAFKNEGSTQENNSKPVTTESYTRYVNAKIGLNIRNTPSGTIIGSYKYGTAVTVYETSGDWSRTDKGWVSSNYLVSTIIYNNYVSVTQTYRTGNYRVTASVLNVRTGPSTNYRTKKYYELTANARSQNSRLGGYYTNGLRRGVVTYVYEVRNGFGRTNSGWISMSYCTKL